MLLPLLLPIQVGNLLTAGKRNSYKIYCNRDTECTPSQTVFILAVWHFAAVLP